MSKYVIRAVDIRNPLLQEAIAVLHVECFGEEECRYKPTEGYWWLVHFEGDVVGFAGISASRSWLKTGYLCRAGVLPGHRGHGLQKRLIKVRLKKAKALGWTHAITDTRDNPASSNSLISCGFRMYRATNPWGFADACYWRKSL
jgi:GNAT superfamily N-acetyltransferase